MQWRVSLRIAIEVITSRGTRTRRVSFKALLSHYVLTVLWLIIPHALRIFLSVWTFLVYGIMNFTHCHCFTLCNPFLLLLLLLFFFFLFTSSIYISIYLSIYIYIYILWENQLERWSKKSKMLLPFIKSNYNWSFLCHFHKWFLFFALSNCHCLTAIELASETSLFRETLLKWISFVYKLFI